MPRLSTRVRSLKPSATLAIAAKAKALTRQGVPVVNFSLGEPDFETPAPARRAAERAIEAGQTHYAPTIGDPETRAVVAEKLVRENGLRGVTGDHVAISSGAKHSLYLVLHSLLDPRDDAGDVLLPTPSWVSYAPISELAGGRVVELPTTPESDFKISPAQLRAAITPRSRVLMLNTPSNPCGTMYTPDELRALAAVVAEAARTVAPELIIVVDEIYEKIVFGGIEHLSIGSIPEVAERTVTINGLSKAFAMTGWRVGYAACPGEFGLALMRGIDALQGQMTSCIPAFILPAIRAALKECGAETEAMREAFARRARLIYDLASGIPGLRCPRPTGAFYIFPDVSAFFGKTSPGGAAITDSLSFGAALLNEAHVAVVPGVEFGSCGGDHVRVSFACSEETIKAGMGAIARFTASLR
ncbi:MAG: pyridoxal phosphate-dependent aminotransferase [Phycisphaerales bacterium]|nr:pyridoxal phosphate-dependent aminotransferase [Phycisphaerales bacterium]